MNGEENTDMDHVRKRVGWGVKKLERGILIHYSSVCNKIRKRERGREKERETLCIVGFE